MSYSVVDDMSRIVRSDAYSRYLDPNVPRPMVSPMSAGPRYLAGAGSIEAVFRGRQWQTESLKGVSFGGASFDPAAIVQPVVDSLRPAIDREISAIIPRLRAEVTSAISAGITQGINANLPKIRAEIAAQKSTVEQQLKPAKAYAVAVGLVCLATLGVSLAVLTKQK